MNRNSNPLSVYGINVMNSLRVSKYHPYKQSTFNVYCKWTIFYFVLLLCVRDFCWLISGAVDSIWCDD